MQPAGPGLGVWSKNGGRNSGLEVGERVHAGSKEGLTRKHWVRCQPLHCILKGTSGCCCILKQMQMKGNWRVERLR